MNSTNAIRIKHLFISPGHNFIGHHDRESERHPIIECAEIRCLADRGIEGDRFLDFKPDYKGQITFFSDEVYADVCEKLAVRDKPASAFRRNIIVEGADLNELIGQEFEVQGVRFLGTEESAPCDWMNQAFSPGAKDALKGRGGLRAKILSDGVLRVTAEDAR